MSSNTELPFRYLVPIKKNHIKIIQITDMHISDEDTLLFNDFDTSISLLQIIQAIKDRETDIDLLLLTGDLVHKPTDMAYQKLANYLSIIEIPLFYLPGNHDDPAMMNEIMGSNGFDNSNHIRIGQWIIILLNTQLAGEDAGKVKQDELNFLENCFQSFPNYYYLIAMHHHPVSIHSAWMDAMALKNPDELFNLIDRYEQVRGIVWGHIHQAFETDRNRLSLYGTPSTCLQFFPKSSLFRLDDKPPAYRYLQLKDTGEIKSDVKYL